jgi:protein-tyrosine phosphatase
LRTVLAHPERNSALAANPSWVLNWVKYDPVLQVTGASLVGRLGPICRRAAWAFLDMPLCSVVATDAHDTGLRAPIFNEAFLAVVLKRGLGCAQRVCLENPWALLGGHGLPQVHRGGVEAAGGTGGRSVWGFRKKIL